MPLSRSGRRWRPAHGASNSSPPTSHEGTKMRRTGPRLEPPRSPASPPNRSRSLKSCRATARDDRSAVLEPYLARRASAFSRQAAASCGKLVTAASASRAPVTGWPATTMAARAHGRACQARRRPAPGPRPRQPDQWGPGVMQQAEHGERAQQPHRVAPTVRQPTRVGGATATWSSVDRATEATSWRRCRVQTQRRTRPGPAQACPRAVQGRQAYWPGRRAAARLTAHLSWVVVEDSAAGHQATPCACWMGWQMGQL
jgi:hypothetical protein